MAISPQYSKQWKLIPHTPFEANSVAAQYESTFYENAGYKWHITWNENLTCYEYTATPNWDIIASVSSYNLGRYIVDLHNDALKVKVENELATQALFPNSNPVVYGTGLIENNTDLVQQAIQNYESLSPAGLFGQPEDFLVGQPEDFNAESPIKMFMSQDGSWGDASHLLLGEFTSDEYHEIIDWIDESGGEEIYDWFEKLPTVVDLDSI